MLKKRILSIILCAVMIAGQFTFTAYTASDDFNSVGFLKPTGGEMPSVGNNGFITSLTGKMPEIGSDGLILEPEEALPVLDAEKTGFVREPDDELPSVEPDGFMVELSADLPVQREDGFIKAPAKALPSAREDGFINSPGNELASAVSGSFIDTYDGYAFTGNETGFLKPISAPDANATVITTAEQLASMTSGSYVLANDIDLSAYNGGIWRPVEPQGDLVFDGAGHKIINMTSDVSTYDNCSLFQNYNYADGVNEYNLTVKNVGFETTNKSVIGIDDYRGYGAAIIYNFTGKNLVISNCYNTCAVIGPAGLVGYSNGESVTITDSYNKGKITGYAGIIGCVQSGSVKLEGCFNKGAVTTTVSETEVGGIIAAVQYSRDAKYSAEIINCSNFAKITGTYTTGGIIGEFHENSYYESETSLTIRNCSNKGILSGKYAVGGIIGYAYADSFEVENCFNTGMMTLISDSTNLYCGGIVGHTRKHTDISKCYNTGRIVLTCTDEESTDYDSAVCAAGIVAYSYGTSDVTDCFNAGIVLGTAHYNLYTAGISAYGECTVKRCYNKGDITANEKGTITYTPARFFAAGITACGGNSISDSYNTARITSYEYAAGITTSKLTGGKISNCFNSGAIKGIIAAGIADLPTEYNYKELPVAVFEACVNIGTVTGTDFAAGIVYSSQSTSIDITSCLNEGEITAMTAAGIIKVDRIKPEDFHEVFTISSCLNTGAITGEYDCAGIYSEETQDMYKLDQTVYVTDCMNTGVITWGNGILSCGVAIMNNCTNSGEILNGSGLFSSMYGSVYNSCNTAPVTGGCGLGYGLMSTNEAPEWAEMGDDGEWYDVTVSFRDDVSGQLTDCFNTGKITGSAGLLMSAGSLNVERCYNTADVDTTDAFSGAAGLIFTVDAAESFYISDCYNTGNLNSLSYMFELEAMGGLIGYLGVADNASIKNCYNTGSITHSDSTGNTVVGGIAGAVSVSDHANFYNETILSAYIADCYNTGDMNLSGTSYTVGGIIGLNHDISGSGTIIRCAALGDITFTSGIAGGIAGDCDMDAKYCVNAAAMKTTAKTDDTYMVGIFKRGCDIVSCRLDNTENEYTYAAFAFTCEDIDNCYYKTAVVGDYHSGAFASSCGKITDSYYIGDITLDGESELYGGFAGSTGALNNLFFIGDVSVSSTSGKAVIGGLAGKCPEVLACIYSGALTYESSADNSYAKLGGLAGETDSVKRSLSFGSMYSDGYVRVGGGLAGSAMTAMNCKSAMDIEIYTVHNRWVHEYGADNCAAAGIIASGAVVIYNCTNTGDIVSSIYAGGITGNAEEININSCLNTGKITTTDYDESAYAGGIACRVSSINCRNCINTGDVDSSETNSQYCYAGGIIGIAYGGTVANCINRGNVNGSRCTGIMFFVVYEQTGSGTVLECENYGEITGGIASFGIGGAQTRNCVNYGKVKGALASGMGPGYAAYCLNNGEISGHKIYGVAGGDTLCCINAGNLSPACISSSEFVYSAVGVGYNTERCVNTGIIRCDLSEAKTVSIYGVSAGIATDCYNGGRIEITDACESGTIEISGIGSRAQNCVNDAEIKVTSAGGISIYGVAELAAVNCVNNMPLTADRTGVSVPDEDIYMSCRIYGISDEANNCFNYGDISVITPLPHDVSSEYVYGIGGTASYCENYGDITVNAERGVWAGGVGMNADRSENFGTINVSGKEVHASGIGGYAVYCINRGTVTARGETVYAGGIASKITGYGDSDETIPNCENTANVYAYGDTEAYAGGILAYGNESFANCINSGSVRAYCSGETEGSTHCDAGGIVGFACVSNQSWWGVEYSDRMILENCTNSGSVDATAYCKDETYRASAHAGGLVGDMVKGSVGSNYGTTIYTYSVIFVNDECSNTGTVSAYSSTPNYYADRSIPCLAKGNIYGHGKIYTGSDAYPDAVYTSGEHLVEVGKSIKITASTIPSEPFFSGVSWSSSDSSILKIDTYDDMSVTLNALAEGRAVVKATTQNGLVAEHIVDVLDNTITVTVMGYERFKESEAYPLQGASVTIGSATETTDEEGKAVFERGDLPQSASASLFINAGEDYSEEDTLIGITPSGYSTNYTYHLRKKDYVIIVDSATVTIDHVRYGLVNAPGMKYIPALERDGSVNTDEYEFNVKIDWGKFEDNVSSRKVWLESATAKIQIKEGDNSIAFAKYFQPKEAIKVVAETKNSSGEKVVGEYTLPLKTQVVNVDLTPEPSEDFNLGPIYFLEGLDLKLGLENLSHAADIELKDGMLKLEFGKQKKDSLTKNIELGLFENKNGAKVSVSGFVSIPVNDVKNGEWEGGVKVSAGVTSTTSTDREEGDNGFELFAHKHDFFIGAVPVFIDVELKGGGSGSLSVFGPFGKAYFRGKLEGTAQAELFGGLGGEVYDDCQMKFGPSGTLKATVPMTFEAKSLEETSFEFDPSVEGKLDLKLVVKLFDVVDIEEELDLGHFILDKDGFRTHLDEEKAALSFAKLAGLDIMSSPVKVVGRDYLKNGGGFNSDAAALLSDESSGRVINTVYQNIIECADAELTVIDGNPVLIFSMDNTSRDTYNALNAVYSVYNNGVWSEPVSIEDDGTIDSGICASEGFVVWEDTNSAVTGGCTLSEALAKTDISAAVWNGEKFVTYTLTNDNLYDFGAKVSAYNGKAVAAWLSNTEADCTSTLGETAVCYSLYDGSVWSEVVTVANVGKVTNVNVLYGEDGAYVVYKDASLGLKRINALTGEADTYCDSIGRYAVADTGFGTVLADIGADNKMNIYVDGKLVKTVETSFNGSANPVIGVNGSYVNVFWTENDGIYYVSGEDGSFSGKLCFKNDTASVSNLDCVLDENGEFVLTYMRVENGVTDLVTVTAAPGADLVVEELGYNDEAYTVENSFDYTVNLRNNGEDAVNGCSIYLYDGDTQISVTDFDDTVINPGESVVLSGSCELAADARSNKHTFKLEATCDGDFDTSNNSLSIDVGTVDAEMLDATFEVNEVGEESLVVKVKNSGDVDIGTTQIIVRKNSKDGTPLYAFATGAIPVGDTGIFTIPEKQDETAVYYVSVYVPGDENDSNNMDCIAYERVVQNSPVKYDYTTGNATVTIDSEAAGDSGKVVATLYDGDMRVAAVDIADVVSLQSDYTFSLPGAKAGYTVKAMVFNDLESVSPKMPAVVWVVE